MGIQMVECLEYLYERQIIHGDIKGDNCAISAQNPHKIVIFVFGLAHKKNDFTETFHGSLVYASIATHKFEPICVHSNHWNTCWKICARTSLGRTWTGQQVSWHKSNLGVDKRKNKTFSKFQQVVSKLHCI